MYRYGLFLLALILFKEAVSKDIIVSFGGKRTTHENRQKRQVLLRGQNPEEFKWPNNTVHYYFDKEEFDPNMKEPVLRAMDLISNHTCIKYSTEPSETVIRMQSDDSIEFCWAEIGHVKSDRDSQGFSFNSECYSTGLAAHELIHSLGFIHSQQRLDRDQYLEIKKNLDGMSLQNRQQYDIFENQEILVPYDYGSVMQYPDREDEYQPIHKNRFMFQTMGSEIIAFYDYLMINKYYECSCPENSNLKCQNFGYPNPSNCSQCNCPLGYGGVDCSTHAEPGRTLSASEEWQNTSIIIDAGYRKPTNGKKSQVDFIYNYLWITAPANKTTEVRVEKLGEMKCEFGCNKGGIEVKINDDPRLTSPRICCDERQIKRSYHTPTVIMAFNNEGRDEYNVQYRYV
uniref:Zinc metalloproteinase n=1 Tax=Caenorhabditis tropicalis TaxID=1561998 RepID=A0A1I7UAX7_9PELO